MDLYEYLWRNKITQKDFAKRIGIEPHNFGKLVAKKTLPKLITAIKICEATSNKVSYKDFLRDGDIDFEKL